MHIVKVSNHFIIVVLHSYEKSPGGGYCMMYYVPVSDSDNDYSVKII